MRERLATGNEPRSTVKWQLLAVCEVRAKLKVCCPLTVVCSLQNQTSTLLAEPHPCISRIPFKGDTDVIYLGVVGLWGLQRRRDFHSFTKTKGKGCAGQQTTVGWLLLADLRSCWLVVCETKEPRGISRSRLMSLSSFDYEAHFVLCSLPFGSTACDTLRCPLTVVLKKYLL